MFTEPSPDVPDHVYYDGTCGLCHGTVKFLANRPRRDRFRFAPLQGETIAARIPAARRAGLPDSVVVETPGGELLSRSEGVVRLLRRLGGAWRVPAALFAALPLRWRDAAYDFVARRRKRWIRPPEGHCPMVPREISRLFLP